MIRKLTRQNARTILLISSISLIQACGGGSSDTTSNTNSNSAPTTNGFNPDTSQDTAQTGIIAFTDQAKISQPVELFIYYPNDELSNITWKQIEGSTAIFHAGSAKGIAFTPSSAGEYSFQVDFNRNGNNEQLTYSFTVTDQQNQISASLGHAALEGSDVSLRINLDNTNIDPSSILWEQISGPTVTFSESTDGQTAVFFTAQEVNSDKIVEFNVSASDGITRYQDTVAVLIENAADISTNDNTAYTSRLAQVFPFNADSPYADVLANCVYSNNIDFRTTCRFNQLPLIAQDTTNPSIEDIMDRVVVSHHWMGQRFKEFLENNDENNDFKNLLRATTAIVISYDIRPSYYWVVTGAIHLDANNLWLTPDERDTINQAPDFRASFGDSLQFAIPWRYVKNNDYANNFYSQYIRQSRNAIDGVYNLASLMYHELAHANDFFPKSIWASLNKNDRILDAADKIFQSTGVQSDLLATAHPLNGTEMYSLAQVRFLGESATTQEKNYSPSDVTNFFRFEHSPQFYNYSSKREDYAMLFDGFMMKARYGVDRDVAITNNPQSASEQYIVTWGQRGRIGDSNIKPRVNYVARRVLPEFTEASDVINNLATPIAMQAGKTWNENLAISPTINNVKTNTANISSASNQSINNTPSHKQGADGEMYYERPLPFTKRK